MSEGHQVADAVIAGFSQAMDAQADLSRSAAFLIGVMAYRADPEFWNAAINLSERSAEPFALAQATCDRMMAEVRDALPGMSEPQPR